MAIPIACFSTTKGRLQVDGSYGVFRRSSPSRRCERRVDTLVGTLDYGPLRVATGTMGYKHREADLAKVKAALEEPNFPAQDHSARRWQPAHLRARRISRLQRNNLEGSLDRTRGSLALTPHASGSRRRIAGARDRLRNPYPRRPYTGASERLSMIICSSRYDVHGPEPAREVWSPDGRSRSAARARQQPGVQPQDRHRSTRKGEMEYPERYKTAVVTGSTSGIGLACARAFAGAGANIVLNGMGAAGRYREGADPQSRPTSG